MYGSSGGNSGGGGSGWPLVVLFPVHHVLESGGPVRVRSLLNATSPGAAEGSLGIAVIALGEHNAGVFGYRPGGQSSTFLRVPDAVSRGAALLLGPNDELRFEAAEPETATIQFLAWFVRRSLFASFADGCVLRAAGILATAARPAPPSI